MLAALANPRHNNRSSLVTDDDFTIFSFAEHLEALPQHVLGHSAGQVVDVEHLAVVLATEQP